MSGHSDKLVVNLTQGSVVCNHVEIADRARGRMRGLLGRDSLEAGAGMLLQPAPSIHTAFMRFAIDAVFLDGTLRVKKVVENLKPWRVASAHRAWAVLEMAAGEVGRLGIAVGDHLGVVEVTDRVGAVVPSSEGAQGRGFSGATIALESAHTVQDERRVDDLTSRSRRNPEPTRVLLVGNDRRFRSVAATLLTRRGCAVTLSDDVANIAELARLESAEVVVLDTGLALTTAAREAAQITALDPPVGVVIVGEEAEDGLAALPVLPKWGPFEGLFGAIERARPPRVRPTEVASGGRR
jgi:uncharacterized membrane protein (UPF0127 family)